MNLRDWCDATSLDLVTVLSFDDMKAFGMTAPDGSKMLAALKFFIPEISRIGSSSLPRCHRALRAWMLRDPPPQRTPFPWLCLTAVIGVLLWESDVVVALNLLIQFITYLRPGVCDSLCVSQLVPPSPVAGQGFQVWGILLNPREYKIASKTKGFDDSILLDTHLWIADFLHMLRRNRSGQTRLWPMSALQILERFRHAIQVLQLQSMDPCRYRLRHGGASHDLLTQQRTLSEVKNRGHWASDSSLRRYTKVTRSLRLLSQLDPRVLQFGKQVSDNLEDMFHLKIRIPPPSLIGPPPGGKPARPLKRSLCPTQL